MSLADVTCPKCRDSWLAVKIAVEHHETFEQAAAIGRERRRAGEVLAILGAVAGGG